MQSERENEQRVLQEKINALQGLADGEEDATKEAASYYESESSSLMRAQKRIFDVDKELAEKIRERREIEAQLDNVKRQMELQAECNQEQFREMLEKLQRKAVQVDGEIARVRKTLQSQAQEYLKRLR